MQRFGVWVLGSLVLVLMFAGLARPDERKKLNDALKHYEQGVALVKQGQRDAALAEYRAALRADPDEPYWHEALGLDLEKLGDLQAALKEYRLAAELSPYDDGLGRQYERLGRKMDGGAASDPVEAPAPAQPVNDMGRESGKFTPPVALSKPDPPFTEKARIAKYSGSLVLWVGIDAQGNVANIAARRPWLPFGLTEQAIETVRTWKFQPAMRDGTPVSTRVFVEVHFRLLGSPTP